ncbi:MAG: hypothetical protein COB90_02525 [Hyphomicrobiales bacterium]|nr:MAG: hypothetical protein COB90_02525 [Hyphomicrobiales bacterium]
MNWYIMAFNKYFDFGTRSRRSEYWFFVLFNIVIGLVLGWISPNISGLYTLAVLIPGIAVAVRRLHDTDRSGWWLLIFFVPLIGILILIYWLATDSQIGSNRFGANPKDEASDSEPDVQTS